MKELIKKLTEAWGPSGCEHKVRGLIAEEVRGLADEVRTDPLGNLICRKGSGGAKVMIAAHMDEIGLMVSHVDEKGFMRFVPIGGLRSVALYGNRVYFENGVVGTISAEGEGWRTTPDREKFYIDVSTGAEAGPGVGVGDAAAFWREMVERGNRIVAKALDDRIGCVVGIEAMRKLAKTDHEIYFVFTVQEEVGLRGARPAAFGVEPDIGISLDVTSTGDTPKDDKMTVELGKGAAIKVRDGGHIVPPAIKNLMVKRAEEAGIPYQLEVLPGGTTDAAGIQLSRAGIPSGCISIPTRYLHTVSETVDIGDVQACVDLLVEILSKPIEL
ncbi:MAG: M42 family metallopeptidase [Anaerolineae bacterium]|nr:M42 family metallopeptidase [Anaerolineae bacterium]